MKANSLLSQQRSSDMARILLGPKVEVVEDHHLVTMMASLSKSFLLLPKWLKRRSRPLQFRTRDLALLSMPTRRTHHTDLTWTAPLQSTCINVLTVRTM